MDDTYFNRAIRYWWALCTAGGIGLIGILVQQYIGYRSIGFLFLLGVLIVGAANTQGPVIFTAFAGAFIWNFVFIPPRFTFAISSPEDIALCASFFITAVVTGWLTSQARLHERLAIQKEERATFLVEMLKDILTFSDPKEFISRITWRIEEMFGGRCVVHLIGESPGEDLSSFERFEIKGREHVSGHLYFSGSLDEDGRQLVQSVAQQLGLTLERINMEKIVAETMQLAESNRLNQTLLNSVSHELRTPLTALMGFAGSLNDESTWKTPELRKITSQQLVQAADRMNRVVGNLLDMSRLSAQARTVKKDWHDVNDLLGVVLKDLALNLKNHTVNVDIEGELPLVQIDFHLMEHALANLVLNAANYSPERTQINIRAQLLPNELRLMVSDQGPGIAKDSLSRIFEKFYRAPGTPPGGTGLGLSIVKSIIELHGGSVYAENLKPNGCRFTISIPAGVPPSAPMEDAHG